MINVVKAYIKRSNLFRLYCERGIKVTETKRFLSEIPPVSLLKDIVPENYTIKSLLADYKRALKKHRVTWSEYFWQYEYYRLSEEERNTFVSRSNMQKMYRRLVNKEVRELMHNKEKFLDTFSSYIHRRWLRLSENTNSCATKEQLKELIESVDCIVKPISGSLGCGIRKIYAGSIENIDLMYQQLCKEDVLVEECLRACDEIQALNPDSLNTIRIVTISKAPKVVVFGAFIRMGRKGAIVDNAHAGGIFAQINVDSGVIESCGITTNGDSYDVHPDSGIKLVGFKIPHWEEIKKQCTEAALVIDNLHFSGWDVCVRHDGKIEFIEGNHAPDFDVMQSPLKIGVKERLNNITTDYFNYKL